jgi:hypothetical protein
MAASASPARLRLPSLGTALGVALATLRRFPLVLASGVAAATAAVLISEDLGPAWLHDRLLAAATLGLPLLTAVTLLGERVRSAVTRAALALAALAVLVAVHASWAGWSKPVQAVRYAELSLAFHLLVAFLPLVGRDRPTAFWQYNRALFERFLVAAVSSGTLFLGLALALAALDKLFGVELPRQAYFRVWVLCAFVFNTWFFLGGVPDDLDALDERREYPAPLRVFAQYTLVPLVTVYLVILTLYFGKVVVSWDWPSGWIGYLVSGVAGAGILALLLVHPLAEREDQRWIAAFARDFWLGILPAVVMLWLAIYQRVHQYGFTEPRYFLLVLSVWLAAIAVYYAVTRSRKIRAIPTSLCVLTLLTFAGPWGAFSVSRRSQVGRVRDVLVAHGILLDGHIRRATADVPPSDRRALSGAVRYLVETHGSAALAPLLGDSLAARAGITADRGRAGSEGRARAIVEALGIPYVPRWENPAGQATSFSFRADDRGVIPVAGYDVLLSIRNGPAAAQTRDSGLVAVVAREARSIRILRAGQALLDVPLDSLLTRARTAAGGRRGGVLPASVLRAEAANPRARAVVLLRSAYWEVGPTGPAVRNANGLVLLMLRPGR